MAENISPDQTGAPAQSSPQSLLSADHPFVLTQQLFEVCDRVSRLDERVIAQKDAINKLDTNIGTLGTKIDTLSRHFGYISKSWWLLLIGVGALARDLWDLVKGHL